MDDLNKKPWECPRCNKINAPWLAQCTCQPKDESYTKELYQNAAITLCQSESDHEWECLGISTAGDTYRCSKCGKKKQYLLNGTVVES